MSEKELDKNAMQGTTGGKRQADTAPDGSGAGDGSTGGKGGGKKDKGIVDDGSDGSGGGGSHGNKL